jgi:type II secretory pathway component PulF
MAEQARGGGALADEIARFPGVFNAAHVGLVRAGELGGFIVDALKELVSQIEADLEARRRCTVWILHFWIVAGVAVWLAIPMASIVRPAAEAIDPGAGLPAVLRAFLFFSVPVTLGILAAVFGSCRVVRHPGLRRRWHRILLRLPVFGGLAVGRCRAIFAASLRLLYRGGVNPIDAWSAASEAVPNAIWSERLAAQTAAIHSGGRFSDAMRDSELYPASDVGLMITGERTGNIEEVLGRIADFYHQDAGAALARLPTIARTALLLLAAAIAVPAVGYGFAEYFNGIFEGISHGFGGE